MRKVGSIPESRQAECFADYLLTAGISTRIEPEGDEFAVWIRDEQQVAEGRRELDAFLSNPEEERELGRPRRRNQVAEALARAVLAFGKRYDALHGVRVRWNAAQRSD